MLRLRVSALLLFIAAPAFGSDFSAEDSGLVPTPEDVAAVVRSHRSFADFRSGGCSQIVGRRVDLEGRGQVGDWIVTTANGCGWAAASAPIWVLRNQAHDYALVLASNGIDVTIETKKSHHLRPLTISAGTAGWHFEDLFKFDGQRYALKHSRHVDLQNSPTMPPGGKQP